MDATKANEILQSLTVADILKVYSGKPGCACGCNGEYRITAESRKEADKDRGYDHDDTDVNPRQVLKVLRNVQAAAADVTYFADHNKARGDAFWAVDDDLYYIVAQVSARRTYTVYLTSAARRARGVQSGYALQ